jgi:hypothetical protein
MYADIKLMKSSTENSMFLSSSETFKTEILQITHCQNAMKQGDFNFLDLPQPGLDPKHTHVCVQQTINGLYPENELVSTCPVFHLAPVSPMLHVAGLVWLLLYGQRHRSIVLLLGRLVTLY